MTTTTEATPAPVVVPSFDNPEAEGRKLAIICSKGNLDMAYPGPVSYTHLTLPTNREV